MGYIKSYLKNYFRDFDYMLFFTYLFLCLFGLVMVYSAGMVKAITSGNSPDMYYIQQLRSIIISFFALLFFALLPYKAYAKKPLIIALTAVLIILLIWLKVNGGGEEVGGKRWINLGFMRFQPSEYAKLFIILYFSSVFSNRLKDNNELTIKNIWQPACLWIFITGMVIAEPDIGATGIILAIATAIIFTSGLRLKEFFKVFGGLMFMLAITFSLLYLFFGDKLLTANRKARITTFLNPFEDPANSGLQLVQGFVALGTGGLKGLGIGQSIQKLGYLPEPQTDFIFAIISEELGLLGVSIVIFGLGFIVTKGLWLASRLNDDALGRMLATGIATWIGIQTFFNLGGLLGIIPLTGVTLPFISYGGTSLLMLSIAMGILLNVSTVQRRKKRLSKKI